MEMILKSTNFCKSFSGQTVVNNISLKYERNSIYGRLLGANGAGKSTTLKMITGILKPTSGSIEFNDHTWKRSDLNHIGIIIESVWQISLCLYLARKTGLFLPIVLNMILGLFLPIVLGNTVVWWLVPYCYAAKFTEPLMGIELKGIARYIPFSWSMNWVWDILSRQLFNYETEKIWIAALTIGGLLLTLLWFSHWEGRKKYE